MGAAKSQHTRLVADFAMGDGSLLKAAEARWPEAKLFGAGVTPAAAIFAGDFALRIRFEANDFLSQAEATAFESLQGGATSSC